MNNAFPTVVRGGKAFRVKSTRAKKYEEAVRNTLALWLNHHGRRAPLPPYRLSLRVFPPRDGQRHDLTNCFKLPEDSLMAAIGGDDADVMHVEADKEAPDAWPRLVVVLEGETS